MKELSIDDIVPELKESEDERIRKKIIAFLTYYHTGQGNSVIYDNDWIAWLEKQGKQKSTEKIESDKKFTPIESALKDLICDVDNSYTIEQVKRFLFEYGYKDKILNAAQEEMQKPTEKIVQKPIELDENRSKELSLSLQIQAYLNTASDELYAKGKPLYSEKRIEDIHKCMLMWQMLHNAYFYQKPAEIVKWSPQEESCICQLESLVKEQWRQADKIHNSINIKKMSELMFFLKTLNPNKKPQRIISAEAKEAMYDKSVWSENDEKMLEASIGFIKSSPYPYSGDTFRGEIGKDETENWLKSLKDRVLPQSNWSDENERMIETIIGHLDRQKNYQTNTTNIEQCQDWLKSLKERIVPQLKQEWNAKDEKMLNLIIAIFEVNHPNGYFKANESNDTNKMAVYTEEIVAWLKSLRPRSQWKPSDEQMEALKSSTYCQNEQMSKVLFELYQDLKKLREE